jgi:hypothetical protein
MKVGGVVVWPVHEYKKNKNSEQRCHVQYSFISHKCIAAPGGLISIKLHRLGYLGDLADTFRLKSSRFRESTLRVYISGVRNSLFPCKFHGNANSSIALCLALHCAAISCKKLSSYWFISIPVQANIWLALRLSRNLSHRPECNWIGKRIISAISLSMSLDDAAVTVLLRQKETATFPSMTVLRIAMRVNIETLRI